MNKTDLIEKVASMSEVSKGDAARMVNAFIAAVTDALSKPQPEPVTIVGFGTFKVTERRARKGLNPATGKEINIPAKKAPRFSAGKQLKDACNQGSAK